MFKRFFHKRCSDNIYINHGKYGRVYLPLYNPAAMISSAVPPVFNSQGEPMDFYFIRDRHFAHNPYSLDTPPSHWLWDRYNFGLKTHFYSDFAMFEVQGNPERCFGFLPESQAIVPEAYRIFDRDKGRAKAFNAIFTYDSRLLNELDNAKFVPFAAAPWYGTVEHGGVLDEKAYEKKSKMISMISSNKAQCDLHKYRMQVAWDCKNWSLADTYGTFDGGPFVQKYADILQDYRYSVTIENDISPYYFSERLTAAFAAMTVPIYCGAERIGDYFNEDGIIRIKPGDDIRQVLSQCSVADYEARRAAIIDNYHRALEYNNIWDWMYNRYLKEGSNECQ